MIFLLDVGVVHYLAVPHVQQVVEVLLVGLQQDRGVHHQDVVRILQEPENHNTVEELSKLVSENPLIINK